jgi:hypothetical protein
MKLVKLDGYLLYIIIFISNDLDKTIPDHEVSNKFWNVHLKGKEMLEHQGFDGFYISRFQETE